jgi:hypothetical protein
MARSVKRFLAKTTNLSVGTYYVLALFSPVRLFHVPENINPFETEM